MFGFHISSTFGSGHSVHQGLRVIYINEEHGKSAFLTFLAAFGQQYSLISLISNFDKEPPFYFIVTTPVFNEDYEVYYKVEDFSCGKIGVTYVDRQTYLTRLCGPSSGAPQITYLRVCVGKMRQMLLWDSFLFGLQTNTNEGCYCSGSFLKRWASCTFSFFVNKKIIS